MQELRHQPELPEIPSHPVKLEAKVITIVMGLCFLMTIAIASLLYSHKQQFTDAAPVTKTFVCRELQQ